MAEHPFARRAVYHHLHPSPRSWPPNLRAAADKKPLGLVSNFALHLDTLSGTLWSADYPYYIERVVRQALGSDVVSIFGTGCCGDIN